MKIIFNRLETINTISPLMCAIGRSNIPAVECILIEAKKGEALTLTTFDLEKGVRCNCNATVLEEGFYCINAQKLFQTLKVMEGEEVTLTVNEKLETTISSGRSTYKMSALRGEDFPQIPSLKTQMGFELSSPLLRRTIGKISFAMAQNDQRQVLNGAFFRIRDGEMLAVACDTFKLAKCVCKANLINRNSDGEALRYSYIVPNKTINELYRMLPDDEEENVTIYISRKTMVYHFDGLIFFTKIIEGEYIDFERIILTNHKIIAYADKDKLLAALERAAVVTEEKIAGSNRTPLKFSLESGILKLTANSSAGSSYDELEVEHTGGDILIAFNNRFLIDSVRACSTERVKIELSTPLYSINIKPVDPEDESDDLFFLLPVRMKN